MPCYQTFVPKDKDELLMIYGKILLEQKLIPSLSRYQINKFVLFQVADTMKYVDIILKEIQEQKKKKKPPNGTK